MTQGGDETPRQDAVVSWTGEDPEVLDFDTADERLGGSLSEDFEGEYDDVLFFPGDVVVHGDLVAALDELPQFAQADPELIVVAGDLTVDGRIALYESLGLYVGGVTRAHTLEGENPEIVIHDAALRDLLYGEYNDGTITAGDVEVPWYINSDHAVLASSISGTWISVFGDLDGADFNQDDLVAAFVPEVLDDYDDEEDAQIDIEAFLGRLAAGKSVLRPRARTARQRTMDKIRAARAKGATALDLKGAQLRQIPRDLLAMAHLRSLTLDDNEIDELPRDMSGWSELEHLSLARCRFTELPESLGQLTRLRSLNVAGNLLGSLPDVFDTIPDLEELDVSEPVAADPTVELPASLAATRLRRLRSSRTNLIWNGDGDLGVTRVTLRGTSSQFLTAVPDVVRHMPHLHELDLTGNYLEELPAWLLDLRELRELRLSSSLAKLSGPLPDFSRLAELTVLTWGGGSQRSDVPEPGHETFRALLAQELVTLEQLDLDRWGSKPGIRPTLRARDLAGIGRYRNLRRLDLSFCGLFELPEELFGLTHLEALNLRYNDLPAAVRARVVEAFPDAQIDLSDQMGPHIEMEERRRT